MISPLTHYSTSSPTARSPRAKVAVGCLEHGRLISAVRSRNASLFERASRLHSDALWQLELAVAALGAMRRDAAAAERTRIAREAAIAATHQSQLDALRDSFETEQAEREAANRERHEQARVLL